MQSKLNIKKIAVYTLLGLLTVLVVMPFIWMLLASVKTSNEVFSIPMKLLPKKFQWVNYQTIWKKIPLLTFFKNTFKIAVLTTILQVLTSCFAAYGFTKIPFKGRDTLFLISVTTFAVPWQAYMVSQFALVSRLHLTDSHLGLILMQAFSGFGVFLIRQFMISIPNELLEAARIDGLSEYGIFATSEDDTTAEMLDKAGRNEGAFRGTIAAGGGVPDTTVAAMLGALYGEIPIGTTMIDPMKAWTSSDYTCDFTIGY